MKKKFHVISNTHWDREWRFPFQRNRQMLVDMIDKVLDILEHKPEYRAFHLDSQSIVLKDYFEVKPHKKELVTRLVQENRLLIGPWYILPEEFQVGGENLIRNLLLGHKVCKEYGGVSKIGYSPFSWGQISQLPQIYKEFEIDLIMFYRGVNSLDSKKSEFLWIGADGTKAVTSRFSTMPRYNFYFYIYRPVIFNQGFYDVEHPWNKFGTPFHFADKNQVEEDYFNLNPEDSYFKENVTPQVEKIIEDQADDFTTPNVIWMEGHDSSGPNPATVRIIKDIKEENPELDVVHSTLEEYARDVYDSVDIDKLAVVEGERRSSQYDLRSGNMYGYTTSARMYLKQKNFDAERWIQFYAEPFNVFAGIFGKDIDDNYPVMAWEYIVQNSAHDSIGGCSLDEIHEDMMWRYKQSIEISKGLFERSMKYFASRVDTSELRVNGEKPEIFVTLVNPNNYSRNEVVEVAIDIPEKLDLGDFDVYSADGKKLRKSIISSELIEPVLEQMINRPMYFKMNRYVTRIETGNIDGFSINTLSVISVKSADNISTEKNISYGEDYCENEFVKIEINQDGTLNVFEKVSGMTYKNIGYLVSEGEAGHAWTHVPVEPVISTLNSSPEIEFSEKSDLVAKIRIQHKIEIPANLEERRKSGKTIPLLAEVEFSLCSTSKHIEINVEVDNKSESHRLRMVFPTEIDTSFTYGEGQFDVVKRILDRPDTSDWVEQPMYDFPMHNFVTVTNENVGASILVDGLKEYEILPYGKNSIAITLFRAFEYIIAPSSKQDYRWQKGSQCLGSSNYRFAFYPHTGGWEEGKVYKEAFNFNNSLRAYQTGLSEGDLPSQMSMMKIEPEQLVFSAFKKAEDGDGFILRVYNPTNERVEGKIYFVNQLMEVSEVTLEEIEKRRLEVVDGNSFSVIAEVRKICTYKLKFE
ncbi:MAG: alpha-mannosidase [Melioribacteraceae bacterium]|nr:MAG: alpha-mannosidase [Melioribacteraceae bacterium]